MFDDVYRNFSPRLDYEAARREGLYDDIFIAVMDFNYLRLTKGYVLENNNGLSNLNCDFEECCQDVLCHCYYFLSNAFSSDAVLFALDDLLIYYCKKKDIEDKVMMRLHMLVFLLKKSVDSSVDLLKRIRSIVDVSFVFASSATRCYCSDMADKIDLFWKGDLKL